MHLRVAFVCLFLVYNVHSQDCCISTLPLPLQNLLSQKCCCPEPNCGCTVIQAPVVPPCGCYNPAIGLPNPIIGVQSCACGNSLGGCSCGNPVVGNLCGRSTPTVGIATTCGCSDPPVRIVDGCPRCQPVYSYNLPAIGCPSCGYVAPYGYFPPIVPSCGCGYPCGCGYAALGCGCSPCSCGAPCGCNGPCVCGGCGCNGPCVCGGCGCNGPCVCGGCGCNGPCFCGGCNCGCAPVNACGCVEVPCGLPKVKTTCTCVTPTIETPCGCIQGKPTCTCASTVEVPTCGVPVLPPYAPVIGCPRYLRQVCVQPPFM